MRFAPALKIRSLIRNHQRTATFRSALDSGLHHGEVVFAESVHLGVKLDAKHTIAQVENGSSRIVFYDVPCAANVVEHNHARPLSNGSELGMREIEILGFRPATRVGVTVE